MKTYIKSHWKKWPRCVTTLTQLANIVVLIVSFVIFVVLLLLQQKKAQESTALIFGCTALGLAIYMLPFTVGLHYWLKRVKRDFEKEPLKICCLLMDTWTIVILGLGTVITVVQYFVVDTGMMYIYFQVFTAIFMLYFSVQIVIEFPVAIIVRTSSTRIIAYFLLQALIFAAVQHFRQKLDHCDWPMLYHLYYAYILAPSILDLVKLMRHGIEEYESEIFEASFAETYIEYDMRVRIDDEGVPHMMTWAEQRAEGGVERSWEIKEREEEEYPLCKFCNLQLRGRHHKPADTSFCCQQKICYSCDLKMGEKLNPKFYEWICKYCQTLAIINGPSDKSIKAQIHKDLAKHLKVKAFPNYGFFEIKRKLAIEDKEGKYAFDGPGPICRTCQTPIIDRRLLEKTKFTCEHKICRFCSLNILQDRQYGDFAGICPYCNWVAVLNGDASKKEKKKAKMLMELARRGPDPEE